MMYLPPELLLPVVFVFGVVLGSFANVIIDRMHTGKSLNDRSRCFSCGKSLAWYELFPLLSFIFLKGRCQGCRAKIPVRFFVVELVMGLIFVSVVAKFGLTAISLLSLILAFCLLVIVIYDIRHLIIPNELVVLVALVSLAIVFLRENVLLTPSALLPAFLTGLAALAFYGGLWLISRGRWIGLGDAKLAFGLGLLLSFTSLFSFVVWSFWIGAVISLGLMTGQKLLQKGTTGLGLSTTSLKMKSEVPFAPFLIIAFAIVYLFEFNVLDLINYVINLGY